MIRDSIFWIGVLVGFLPTIYILFLVGWRPQTKKTICVSCGEDVKSWNYDKYIGCLCESCAEYIEET